MIPRICFEATGCSDESPDGERWREHEIPCHAFQKKKEKKFNSSFRDWDCFVSWNKIFSLFFSLL
jgi:hypothetical protein